MKKLLNRADDYALETLEGLVLAYPQFYAQHPQYPRVIQRPQPSTEGLVGIVTGGGSGHLPVFAGYVGEGLLNGCAVGDVFASPSAVEMAAAIKSADGGAGVLCLYGNYGGDIMNFEMASEMVEIDGIDTRHVLVADDVASAPLAERNKRRGVAGMVYAFKIAGAYARTGATLDEVAALTQKATDATRTMGVALSPCIVPQAGKPTFSLGDDEMEIGMGIHGEPGVKRGPLQSADSVADTLLDAIMDDLSLEKGEPVSVLVNSLGATPMEELLIVYKRVHARLKDAGVAIIAPQVGRFATSMEMSGASLTVMRLDSQLHDLLVAPASCGFWVVQ